LVVEFIKGLFWVQYMLNLWHHAIDFDRKYFGVIIKNKSKRIPKPEELNILVVTMRPVN